MTEQEIQFIEANMINFETAKIGYTKTIDQSILVQYEAIYKKYIDPHFVLTYWCGACVFDMIKRLIVVYETEKNIQTIVDEIKQEAIAQPVVQTEPIPAPKKKRKAAK